MGIGTHLTHRQQRYSFHSPTIFRRVLRISVYIKRPPKVLHGSSCMPFQCRNLYKPTFSMLACIGKNFYWSSSFVHLLEFPHCKRKWHYSIPVLSMTLVSQNEKKNFETLLLTVCSAEDSEYSKIQNKFGKSARRPLRSQYQNNRFISYRIVSVKINQI